MQYVVACNGRWPRKVYYNPFRPVPTDWIDSLLLPDNRGGFLYVAQCRSGFGLTGGNLTPEVLRVDHNLYHCPAMETPRMRVRGIGSFAEWQERGFNGHSIIADPPFRDAGQDDYTLRPASPAFTLGFETIDTRRIGLLTPR